MDAVDPVLVDQAEDTLRGTAGVLDVGQVRLRWTGHQIHAECEVILNPDITAIQAHQVTVTAEHDLLHAIPHLAAALVHADPAPRDGTDPHHVLTGHHTPTRKTEGRQSDPAPHHHSPADPCHPDQRESLPESFVPVSVE